MKVKCAVPDCQKVTIHKVRHSGLTLFFCGLHYREHILKSLTERGFFEDTNPHETADEPPGYSEHDFA
jgi:hypothetical protein